jgi:ABC-2 type transport system ATP-binding protein
LPSLQAINLTKKYGSFVALSNLNLNIDGSKCVGFLGPNGAGKTTTLKIFSDMLNASSGEAIINGIKVRENKKQAFDSCGVLIESPEIYPSFTPQEALSMISDIRGIPKADQAKRIEDAISEVKMQEWKDERFGKFSKGMKQRINLASALLSDPEILLLDEPSNGLDPRGMVEVREIVKSLKKRNRLIFMSSHMLNEVHDICDEIALIDRGKLLAYESISSFVSKMSGESSVVEIGLSKPADDALIEKIRAMPDVVSVERMDLQNVRINFNGGLDVQERLLGELASMRMGMISFRASSSALEQTYLNLIQQTL